MKFKNYIIPLPLILFLSCTSLKVITPEKFTKIVSKPVELWSYEDCDNIILKYTSFNKKGYENKFVNVTNNGERVYIMATPLNEYVILAKIKKESIIRRYSENDYKKRLKEELEFYTNKTLNLSDGSIILKGGLEKFYQDKISFDITFENISEPREPIEIEYASEGFFLENSTGDFARVVDVSGYYVDDYFVLIDKLKMVVTFSIYDDNGKSLFNDTNSGKGHKLVFNGIQPEPILVEWGEENKK